MATLQAQLRTVQDNQWKNVSEKSDSDTPNVQLSFTPKLPQLQAESPGQPSYGRDALVIQSSKPLACPLISNRRGPNIESDSVEVRLNQAMNTSTSTRVNDVQVAIIACGNGEPMMNTNEYSIIYALLRPDDLMLEWGAGKSSCVWAQKVGSLHSIEHDSIWMNVIHRQMRLSTNQVIHWMPSSNVISKPMCILQYFCTAYCD